MVRTIQKIKTKLRRNQAVLDLPMSLRTAQDELTYMLAKHANELVPLINEKRIKEWKFWALIDNKFPYSAAFKTHHMLIPKREVQEKKLNASERFELIAILEELRDLYDCQLINFTKKQSIRRHYHIHLLEYKNSRQDITY